MRRQNTPVGLKLRRRPKSVRVSELAEVAGLDDPNALLARDESPLAFREPDKAESSLAEFLRQSWPILEPITPLEWGWHLDAMCEHLEAVTLGQIQNLLILIPPGCTKSILTSVVWPAWVWTRTPGIRWLTASCDKDIATRDAGNCRLILESDEYKAAWGHRFRMTSDQNVKTWYVNSARGHRVATSTGSSATGKKGDILIVDDPNDAKKVDQPAYCANIIRWWDQAFYNRVNNHATARRVVIGQRTKKNDLQGHIIESGEFEVLRIPEQFDSVRRCTTKLWTDPRTEDGEWLRPTRFGPKEAESAKRRMGSVGYALQHQQRGTSPEGKHFKAHWFKRFAQSMAGEGFVFSTDGIQALKSHCTYFAVVDPATGKKNGDRTGIAVFAYHERTRRLLIVEAVVKRLPIADESVEDLLGVVRRICRQYPIEFVSVESDGFQRQVAERIRDECRVTVREVSHENRGKLTRAQVAVIAAEAGEIWVSESDDWVEDYIEALCGFTGEGTAEEDEEVDLLSYACQECERMSAWDAEPGAVGSRESGRRVR